MSNDDNNGITSNVSNIEYVRMNINELKIAHLGREKGKNSYDVTFDNQKVTLSGRFWNSLGSRFGFNQSYFKYFRPEEVLERVQQVHGADAVVRMAIEKNKHGNFEKLLAVSSVDKQIVQYNPIIELLMAKGGRELKYNNGIISGIFTPSSGEQAFSVNGDEFRHMYEASFAVDGYGDPKITLALERLVCLNGMVAKTKAHTAGIKLGKDEIMHTIGRALETYANEEGFDLLVRQIEKAQMTTASINECNTVGKVLSQRVGLKPGHGSQLQKFHQMCAGGGNGSLLDFYGEASLDSLDKDFQKKLPSGCKVYDLLNFVTELNSHHVNESDFQSRRALHELTGNLLSGRYDLEGMETGNDDFTDLFITDKKDTKGFYDK